MRNLEKDLKTSSEYVFSTAKSLSILESNYQLMYDIVSTSYIMSDLIELHGGKILAFGNGGSATDAQHFIAELIGKFNMVRSPIEAICLSDNIAALTAVANDFSYSDVFSRQVSAFADISDSVIGISTSGKSVNVLKALRMANKRGAYTILLTGNNDIEYKFVKCVLRAPSKDTSTIQNLHIVILHIMAMIIERELFGDR